MKHVKILGFAAVAAMALMAFAANSASATALYNGGTKLGFGAEVDFSLKSGTSANLVETSAPNGEGKTLDTCKSSTVKGRVTNPGGSTFDAFVDLEEVIDSPGEKNEKVTYPGLTWGTCTFPTSTVMVGSLDFSQIGTGTNATVEAALETAVTINTIFFGSCVYSVDLWADIGTLTTSSSGTAEMHVNAVAQKSSGSNIACPSTAVWTATYVSTTPDNLRVEAS